MPYVGRYTRYPIYPQFGGDPTAHNNTLAIPFEHDNFLSGSTIDFQVKTADKEIRVYDLLVEFYNGEVDFTIIEDVTCTDGVPVPVSNTDRNSVFVPSITAYNGPTGIVGGTVLSGMEHFGIPSPIAGLGDVPPTLVNYITLKFNSNYIFRFQNQSAETIIDFRFLLLFAE